MGLRLEFGPGGWVLGLKARGGTEKKKEKFPLCESIRHWPLQGHCPKGDQPTDRLTDRPTDCWVDGRRGVQSRVARDQKTVFTLTSCSSLLSENSQMDRQIHKQADLQKCFIRPWMDAGTNSLKPASYTRLENDHLFEKIFPSVPKFPHR